jgi:hypothetical protein
MFRRPVLLLVFLLLVLIGAGLLAIGAFPPSAATSPVERTLSNDRFKTR